MRIRTALAAGVLAWALALAGLTPAQPFGYSVQSDFNDHLYRINLATGEVTDLGLVGMDDAEGMTAVGHRIWAIGGTIEEVWDFTHPPGFRAGFTIDRQGIDAGFDRDPTTGRLYNIQGGFGGGSWLYEIDFRTGGRLVGTSPFYADSLAINARGEAFAADFSADTLYRVDLQTGVLDPVGPLGVAEYGDSGLAFDPASGVLYAINDGVGPAGIYTIDTNTGAATRIATVQGQVGFEGLAIPASVCPGDLDGDRRVDQADLGILLAAFGRGPQGDIDGDGDTDQADLGVLLSNWQRVCDP